MKKNYNKPLVYCENNITGVTVSNDCAYEKAMKEKLKEFYSSEEKKIPEHRYGKNEN